MPRAGTVTVAIPCLAARCRIASATVPRTCPDNRIGLSQPWVSRVERGDRVPPVPAVEAWTRATGASAEKRLELVELATAVQVENVSWRDALRDGQPEMQREIAVEEAAATALRHFQPILVPGLLQVRPYARHVFELVDPFEDQKWEQATDNRMARQQQTLYGGKELDFVLAEAALWWRPGPVEILLAQIDRLATLFSLPNVSLGIIPRTAEMPTLVMNPFVLYEGPADKGLPFVRVEAVHATPPVHDPESVELYRRRFALLKTAAVFGDEARALLGRIAEELRREG